MPATSCGVRSDVRRTSRAVHGAAGGRRPVTGFSGPPAGPAPVQTHKVIWTPETRGGHEAGATRAKARANGAGRRGPRERARWGSAGRSPRTGATESGRANGAGRSPRERARGGSGGEAPDRSDAERARANGAGREGPRERALWSAGEPRIETRQSHRFPAVSTRRRHRDRTARGPELWSQWSRSVHACELKRRRVAAALGFSGILSST
jgi:hypothetical protein